MSWKRVPQRGGWMGLALLCLGLSSCTSDGHVSVLGYSTAPNYDPTIRTVRVPIFKNETYRRGLEFDLTRAVIREIEAKTPYKVVSADSAADTELLGKIVARNKSILLYTQTGLVREAETTLAVEVVWRDLRPGCQHEFLSGPPPPPPAWGEQKQLPPAGAPVPKVLVHSLGYFRPELGESLTTAEKQNVDRAAVQIVSMMEQPW